MAVCMLTACGGSQNPSADSKESKTEEASKEDTKAPEQSTEASKEESKPAEDEAAPEAPDHNSVEEDKAQEAAVTVKIVATMTGENEMKLSAVVNDPEGRDYTFQWQVSVDGGKTFTDIADETAAEMDVELTEENITDMWRVKVQEI